MLKLKDIRNNKLLVRFILPYMFILLVPLLMGLQGYQKAVDIVKKDIKSSNLSVLNQARNILDGQLKQLETMSMEIAMNPRVGAAVNLQRPLNDSVYYDFSATIKDLSRFTLNRNYINGFYIYLKNTDYVLTPETLYPADIYYESVLKFNKEDYSKWQDALTKNYYVGKYMTNGLVPSDTSVSSNLIYVQSLPLSYIQQSKGALVINFKKDNITELFPSNTLSSGGWAYIQDSEGNIVTSISDGKSIDNIKIDGLNNKEDFTQKRISGKDMIITYTTSSYNGWKYVIALPSDVVFERLNTYKRISWTVFFASLFIGIVIACLLAYQNSRPVLNLVKQLKDFMGEDNSKGNDAFSIINGGISQLIANNKVLENDINNQKPIIQAAFLDKLLKGLIYNRSELTALSSYVGMNIEGSKFAALLVRLYNNDSSELTMNEKIVEEFNISKALVRGLLSECFQTKAIVHDLDHRTIAILINCDTDDTLDSLTEIQDIMDVVKIELLTTYNLRVTIGGGELYEDLLDIWHSVEQAEQALNYIADNKSSVVWYQSIPKESDSYYYPLDLEQRIINHAKAGDNEQVQKMLQIIYDENYISRSLSIHMGKELMYELKSTLVKLMSQLTDEATIKKQMQTIDLSNSVENNFKLLGDIYSKACAIVLAQKSNQSSELMTNIKKYIETNYMDQDISLYKVSSHFNLSEGYFSHLFKEQSGVNFTDYLEKVRMDKAKELLKNKDLNINDISEMVGYNSAQSFRRAFKRLCGVNPTALREN